MVAGWHPGPVDDTGGETLASWRVPRSVPALKLAGAVGLVAIGLLLAEGDPVRPGLAVLVATGLLIWALRDVITPVRLAVDPGGVWVASGYAGRRRLTWDQVERIRVDTRPRLGLRTATLEIDAGESLHLLGRQDLGASPEEVVEMLDAARRRATGPA